MQIKNNESIQLVNKHKLKITDNNKKKVYNCALP